MSDAVVLARLISLVSPMLTSPFGSPEQIEIIEQVMGQADAAAKATDAVQAASDQAASHKTFGVLTMLNESGDGA